MAIKLPLDHRWITRLPSWEGPTKPCEKCGKTMYGAGGYNVSKQKYDSWEACFNQDCEKMNGKKRKY